MIKIDNVSYTYSKGGGVSNINLTIDDGEFVFLIGPTGSGKTTILRLLYLDLFPKAGKVIIDKFDSQTIKKRKIPYLRRRVGVIFQNYHLLEDFTSSILNSPFIWSCLDGITTFIKRSVISLISIKMFNHLFSDV